MAAWCKIKVREMLVAYLQLKEKKKKQAEHTQSNDVYLTVLNIIPVKSKIPQG